MPALGVPVRVLRYEFYGRTADVRAVAKRGRPHASSGGTVRPRLLPIRPCQITGFRAKLLLRMTTSPGFLVFDAPRTTGWRRTRRQWAVDEFAPGGKALDGARHGAQWGL